MRIVILSALILAGCGSVVRRDLCPSPGILVLFRDADRVCRGVASRETENAILDCTDGTQVIMKMSILLPGGVTR